MHIRRSMPRIRGNKHMHILPGALAALALLGAGARAEEVAGPPSFDCAEARSGAEQAVCASADLSALDRVLASVYARAAATPDAPASLAGVQRGWIKGRDDCWKAEDLGACVGRAYAERIAALVAAQPGARGDAPVIGPVAFACAGMDPLRAVFVNAGAGYAVLRWGETTLALPQAISASGARYAGAGPEGEYEFWNKGNEAIFTVPGMSAPAQCKVENS